MNCPHCGKELKRRRNIGEVNTDESAGMLCLGCGEVSLIESGIPRKPTDSELSQMQTSPAWMYFIRPAQIAVQQKIRQQKARLN